MKLVVIIRDEAGFLAIGEPIRHRMVEVEFTEEQLKKLELKETGYNRGKPIHESYSQCFIQEGV